MLRTRNYTLNGTPQQMTIDDMINTPNTISIQNTSPTGFAYIGTENVSNSSYGFKLYPGQGFMADLASEHKLWAVGDSNVTVAVMIIERPQ
jgi:hypothetical protein